MNDENTKEDPNKTSNVIEDLTLNETNSADVKDGGGPIHAGWDLQTNVKL